MLNKQNASRNDTFVDTSITFFCFELHERASLPKLLSKHYYGESELFLASVSNDWSIVLPRYGKEKNIVKTHYCINTIGKLK